MREGVKEMKQDYLQTEKEEEEENTGKQEYVNTAGNTIKVIPPKSPEPDSNVSITIEDEEGRKKKVRRKKRPVRRTPSNEEGAKVKFFYFIIERYIFARFIYLLL